MYLALVALIIGFGLLLWSADKFVDGAVGLARHYHVPSLLIGMVIIGFGTSAPEMIVSALAAMQGNPGIALGNAYGSNITNIALILGLTAVISPIAVHSQIIRKELPLLTIVTMIAAYQLWDGKLNRMEAGVLLLVFTVIMVWSIYQSIKNKSDDLSHEVDEATEADNIQPLSKSTFWLITGLIILIGSSRLLVWGATTIAQHFGVSDLVIGLTVIAVGTSLPELASSIIAARKGEHDLALGNILGSNLFNTLMVVGIAGMIMPMQVGQEVLLRDISVMFVLTLSLFIFGYGFRKQGRINRFEGGILLMSYFGYTAYLLSTNFL